MTEIPDSISLNSLTSYSLTAERGTEPIMNQDASDVIKGLIVALESIQDEFEALSFPELTATRSRSIERSKTALAVSVRNLKKSIQV